MATAVVMIAATVGFAIEVVSFGTKLAELNHRDRAAP
jgi:hypothetical protein